MKILAKHTEKLSSKTASYKTRFFEENLLVDVSNNKEGQIQGQWNCSSTWTQKPLYNSSKCGQVWTTHTEKPFHNGSLLQEIPVVKSISVVFSHD